jgi:hypothetical protein
MDYVLPFLLFFAGLFYLILGLSESWARWYVALGIAALAISALLFWSI